METVSASLFFDYRAMVFELPPSSHFLPRVSDPSESFDAAPRFDTANETGRPRALVVDDAPDVTEMLATFLQHAGYETVMAFSAYEALEAAQSDRFDVIISDIGMPGMNGYDLAVALRALPNCRDVPMIAVTGFSMYDDQGRALESGFNAHLTKPINPMALLNLIESLRH
ncbi:MAG: hypothetical protein QOJ64_3712 [Acidobacteriota bacterium]|jgi:CheY-like chemotaxis protein|nr:hypothetical protein [Acidobacteriota bacterium]